jgi:hypothetical protein
MKGMWRLGLIGMVMLELLLSGCRGGGRGAAAQLPMPTELGQWIALGVFVFGIWWVAMKITRG